MDTEQLKNLINKTVDEKLDSMTNMVTGNHAHNGYDVNQIDPAIGLLGFPVIQVADATVSPLVSNSNDTPQSGTFRFYVDTTPHYRLWAYLTYVNTSSVLVGAWKSLTLA